MYLIYYDIKKISNELKDDIKLAYNKVNSSDNKSILEHMDNELKLLLEYSLK
jgi:hypothetical protein